MASNCEGSDVRVVTYLLAFFLCTGAGVGFAMDAHKKDELLGMVKTIVDVETTMLLEHGDDLYIVSIGTAPIREDTTRGILSARKVSQMLAEKYLIDFIYGTNIETGKLVIKRTRTDKLLVDNVLVDVKTEKFKLYLSRIQGLSRGILADHVRLGGWKSADGGRYLTSYAVNIPQG